MNMTQLTTRNAQIFWLYYKKIFYPAILFALFISLFAASFYGFSWTGLTQSFFVIAPIVQFVQYHIRLPQEYLFFANLGFSKRTLWIVSLCFDLFIILTFIALSLV
jgi:hypothetical protein